MPDDVIRNDEPSLEDRLSRKQYITALARMAATCETPLVVGLYGTWGIGKTSMMQQIRVVLDADEIKTVWFDPWEHQFDENPVLALLHTAVRDLDKNTREQLKTTLISLTAAFSSVALKLLTGLEASNVKKLVNEIEEEQFVMRERQVLLREHFKAIVAAVRKDKTRIVFFIDDLDRCMPPQILSLLEAIKLYLNLDGCVYFLGLDRKPIDLSIQHQYSALQGLTEAEYLDKIIQLPFTIPRIAPDAMAAFVDPLLPRDLKKCLDILVKGLTFNPRHMKRFVNILILNHILASELNILGYDPKVLALLLIIQLQYPILYDAIARNPANLGQFKDQKSDKLLEDSPGAFTDLSPILKDLEIPSPEILTQYIYLTEITHAETGETIENLLSQRISDTSLAAYTKWKYPEMTNKEDLQEQLLKDLNRERFRTLRDLDRAVNGAQEWVEWHKGKHPSLFVSGTDHLTKSLGFYDQGFRQKHAFGHTTRAAFEEWENGRRHQEE